jgi:acetyltransferase
MAGFMHLVTWGRNREALMATPPNLPEGFSPDVERARQIIAGVLARGDVWLDPLDATGLFEAYAIPIAQAILARTPDEAAQVAGPLLAQHGRCVVKIQSRDIQHKSDVGGVVLDLASPQAVREATAAMLARVATLAPAARITGVTVHPMVQRPQGRELIAGLAEDPTFGPVVLFGRGGKAVEVINDRALALPPLDLGLALDLISRTRVSHLLREYRDVPAADLDEVALTLVKLAQMSADLPEIRELDINPLLADEEGVIAMDARVRVAPVEGRRWPVNPRFAVAPYPKQWERWLTGRDGRRVFVRPVRPEDEAMYRTFFAQVSPEDLRLRFFAPVKDFSHAFIARLTQIDYARALALCATLENGEMLGAVRLMLDADRESGEFAILLRSDQKGRGLGWALMKMMIDYGEREGLKHIEGQVLTENTTMLTMCRQLGFTIRDEPDDAGAKQVRLDLSMARQP